jgi:hypothetical protein
MSKKYEPTTKYLAIKDWHKIQAGKDRKGRQIRAWYKDNCTKDFDDPAFSSLTVFQRGLFDMICRACARTGHGTIQNDPRTVIGATCTRGRDASHVAQTLHRLVTVGLLIPTNQQFAPSESETHTDSETETETKPHVAPPVGGASRLPAGEEKTTPQGLSSQSVEQPQPKKPCGCADSLCDWVEAVPGCAHPSSIGNAVYYQRHVKRNDYFISRLTRVYVLKEWKRILADTPEDYAYDADPMLREKRIPIDGTKGEVDVVKEITRRPKNAKERAFLLKDPHGNRKWLFNPACPAKCSEGTLFVSDYPDSPQPSMRRMGHSELCDCVTEDFHE